MVKGYKCCTGGTQQSITGWRISCGKIAGGAKRSPAVPLEQLHAAASLPAVAVHLLPCFISCKSCSSLPAAASAEASVSWVLSPTPALRSSCWASLTWRTCLEA